jgi:hypothetical protein
MAGSGPWQDPAHGRIPAGEEVREIHVDGVAEGGAARRLLCQPRLARPTWRAWCARRGQPRLGGGFLDLASPARCPETCAARA